MIKTLVFEIDVLNSDGTAMEWSPDRWRKMTRDLQVRLVGPHSKKCSVNDVRLVDQKPHTK